MASKLDILARYAGGGSSAGASSDPYGGKKKKKKDRKEEKQTFFLRDNDDVERVPTKKKRKKEDLDELQGDFDRGDIQVVDEGEIKQAAARIKNNVVLDKVISTNLSRLIQILRLSNMKIDLKRRISFLYLSIRSTGHRRRAAVRVHHRDHQRS